MGQFFNQKYPRDEIDEIPFYIYQPEEWFTNKSDYEYLYEFLQGMELSSEFEDADFCLDALIGFNDDLTQLRNNYTVETQFIQGEDRRWMYPLLNVTAMLAEDFAEIFPYCYRFFGIQIYKYYDELYNAMQRNFNTLLISFLFS